MLALQAISAADAGIFERQIKDGVSEEFLAQIKNRIRENETEAVTEHYEQIQIHQTEIANYEKKQGTCMITFQSAVGYLHYCEKAGKVLSGSKELTEQTRYNVQLMYIQNEKLAGMDNAVGTTCPNCGAPQNNGSPTNDTGSIGWGILGCCIPIVGLVLFLVWKDTKPRNAKAAGIGALVSVILSVLYYVFIFTASISFGLLA